MARSKSTSKIAKAGGTSVAAEPEEPMSGEYPDQPSVSAPQPIETEPFDGEPFDGATSARRPGESTSGRSVRPAAPASEDPEAPSDPFAALPADLRASPYLRGAKNLESLARRAHRLGEKFAKVEDLMHKRVADYDDKDARRVIEIGFGDDVPKTAEDADLSIPEMPDGMNYDEALDLAIRQTAVDHRIPMRYVRPLAKMYVEQLAARYGQMVAAQHAQAAEDQRTLQAEWCDDFNANVAHARRAVRAFGGPELVALMNDPRFGSNPAIAKAFASVGRTMAEDGLVDGKSENLLSSSDAANRIAARKNDAEFWASLNDRRDPGHAAALEEWNRLHRAAYAAGSRN